MKSRQRLIAVCFAAVAFLSILQASSASQHQAPVGCYRPPTTLTVSDAYSETGTCSATASIVACLESTKVTAVCGEYTKPNDCAPSVTCSSPCQKAVKKYYAHSCKDVSGSPPSRVLSCTCTCTYECLVVSKAPVLPPPLAEVVTSTAPG